MATFFEKYNPPYPYYTGLVNDTVCWIVFLNTWCAFKEVGSQAVFWEPASNSGAPHAFLRVYYLFVSAR